VPGSASVGVATTGSDGPSNRCIRLTNPAGAGAALDMTAEPALGSMRRSTLTEAPTNPGGGFPVAAAFTGTSKAVECPKRRQRGLNGLAETGTLRTWHSLQIGTILPVPNRSH
jgi:hypothetical protein